MKVALLGYDVEGKASYEYWSRQGHEITIHDQKTGIEIPVGIPAVLGSEYLNNLNKYDLLVRTAGLPPQLILDKNPDVAGKITTHLNEFLRVCPTRNVIGVTGTKGKGTTSTLIAKMLAAAGKHVKLGGNIGVPPLGFLHELDQESWVVLEISSFQAIDLQHSPHIGLCLMVVPEHLNWHPDGDHYFQAKANLFAQQTPDDLAVYFCENDISRHIASTGQAQLIPYYQQPGALVQDGKIMIDNQVICEVSDLKLLGEHNWQNVCAAVTTVWEVTQDTEAMRSVLTTFTGLPFRLEFVRELDGVKYYNDSFGTTPETAIVAIKALKEPKVVILGGAGKGASYDELAKVVAVSNVSKVLLIGEQASRIQAALEAAGFDSFIPGGSSMDEIVRTAQAQTQPGSAVLLSPACASFDMFKDYKDRGQQFSLAVQALA
jgi:UDP-N-acetylmuramoylalanine--D-glutamate ligase